MDYEEFKKRFGEPLSDEETEFWQDRCQERNLHILQSDPLMSAEINIDLLLNREFVLSMSYYGESKSGEIDISTYMENTGLGRNRRTHFRASNFSINPSFESSEIPKGYTQFLAAALKRIDPLSYGSRLERDLVALEYARIEGLFDKDGDLESQVKWILHKPKGAFKSGIYCCGKLLSANYHESVSGGYH